MGEDTEGLVKSTSKLQAKVKALTGGFDIMQDKDNYKDIYDIVVGIGEKWQSMSDIARADLLELLAGKTQSNALAAALDNTDVIKNAYQTAENSAGSAEKEFSNYQKGIEYSIDKFKAQFQELSTSAISSDIFKGAVDSGTALVSVLEKIVSVSGGIPALFSSLATFFSMRNGLGKQLMFQNMFNSI